jgi:hypothetical protein
VVDFMLEGADFMAAEEEAEDNPPFCKLRGVQSSPQLHFLL